MLPKHSSGPCWHSNSHFPLTFLSCGTNRSERGRRHQGERPRHWAGSYRGVAVGHQGDAEGLGGQQQPGGEELLDQEPAARRAQALVEQAQLHRGGRRAREVGAAALCLRAGRFWGGTAGYGCSPVLPMHKGMGQSPLAVGQEGDEGVQGREGSESGRQRPAAAGSRTLPARSAGAFHGNFPKIVRGKTSPAGLGCAWVGGTAQHPPPGVGAAGLGGSQGAAAAVSPSRDVQGGISCFRLKKQNRQRLGKGRGRGPAVARRFPGAVPRCQHGPRALSIPPARQPVPQGCSEPALAPGTAAGRCRDGIPACLSPARAAPSRHVPACWVALPGVGGRGSPGTGGSDLAGDGDLRRAAPEVGRGVTAARGRAEPRGQQGRQRQERGGGHGDSGVPWRRSRPGEDFLKPGYARLHAPFLPGATGRLVTPTLLTHAGPLGSGHRGHPGPERGVAAPRPGPAGGLQRVGDRNPTLSSPRSAFPKRAGGVTPCQTPAAVC